MKNTRPFGFVLAPARTFVLRAYKECLTKVLRILSVIMKKVYTRGLILILLLLLIPTMEAVARQCNKCGGSGRMNMFENRVASYGMSSEEVQCRICKQWFINGSAHTEQCDACGGTGQIGGTGYSSSSSSSSVTDAEIYLNNSERAQIEAIQNLLKGTQRQVECGACQGTGLCPVCHGYGITAPNSPCVGCRASSGQCMLCNGLGHTWQRVMPSKEEKDRLMRMLVEIAARGAERAQNNISPYTGNQYGTSSTNTNMGNRPTVSPQVTNQQTTYSSSTTGSSSSQLAYNPSIPASQVVSSSSVGNDAKNTDEIYKKAAEEMLEKLRESSTTPASSSNDYGLFSIFSGIFSFFSGIISFICGIDASVFFCIVLAIILIGVAYIIGGGKL